MDLLNQYSSDSDENDWKKNSTSHAEEPDALKSSEQPSLDVPDYLGLGSSDSDSDIDNVVSNAKNISSQLRLKHVRKIESHVNPNEEDTKEGTVLPSSDFWTGKNEKCGNWDEPENVWKCDSENDDSSRDICVLNQDGCLDDPIPVPKKRRKDENISHNISKPLTTSCFYIHKRIAPYLNETLKTSAIPRNADCLKGHSGAVNKIEWCSSQFSHLLLSCSMDTTVKIWNAFSPKDECLQVFSQHTKAVKDATWTYDGKNIMSCGYDKTVRVFDVEKGSELNCCTYKDFLTSVTFHPVNRNVFVAGSLNTILLGDCRCKDALVSKYKYKQTFGQVQDLVFIEDGREFFSCADLVSKESSDRNIMAWDFRTGVVLSNQIYQERYTCTRLKMHPQERVLAAQTNGNYVALFSTIRPYKMDKANRFERHKVLGYKVGCDFSREGSMLASGSSDGHIYFYDYRTSRLIKKYPLNNEVCLDVPWHPVLHNTMAVSTWSGSIYILH